MPVKDKEWEDRVKRMLKAELTRKGITYSQLVGLLADIGVMDSEPNIRNKISRGKFTAVFLIQCLCFAKVASTITVRVLAALCARPVHVVFVRQWSKPRELPFVEQ